MWLSVLVVILFAAGVAISIFGGGPIGFVLAGIGILGLAAKFLGVFGARVAHGGAARRAGRAPGAWRADRGGP